VQTITTDFEMALIVAAEEVFPKAEVTACWFHFCQAVVTEFKSAGLQKEISRRAQNSEGRRWMLKLLALPLLPAEDMSTALELLRPVQCQVPEQLHSTLYRIYLYMESFWMLRIRPARLSVYARTHTPDKL
jgi:hypothetical protein